LALPKKNFFGWEGEFIGTERIYKTFWDLGLGQERVSGILLEANLFGKRGIILKGGVLN